MVSERRIIMRQAGFTLMEVLVALVVLGMLFVGLSQGVRLGLSAWNAQSRIVALRDQLDDTDRALRLLLSHIEPTNEADATELAGTADSLSFQTELPTSVALRSRNVDASLFVDASHRLIFSWKPHLHEQSLAPAPTPIATELLAGVQKLEFKYWHTTADDGQQPGWQDKWEAANPPPLIKLHIAFPKGDQRHWPDIVIAPVVERPQE